MACNEFGPGRMSEPEEIVAAIERLLLTSGRRPLAGKRALVTSGPTREAIDPVRYISNHSSGKQGHAIAAALAQLGAEVTLVSGPVAVPDPAGVTVVQDRIRRTRCWPPASPPARVDVAVFAAAVADWKMARPANAKIKKKAGRRAAGARADAQPRHPRDALQARPEAAEAGGGLRRRDREPGRQRDREADPQGLRLDRRQRRLARHRDVRRRAQHGAPDQRRRRAGLADAQQGAGRHAAGRRHRAASRPARPAEAAE